MSPTRHLPARVGAALRQRARVGALRAKAALQPAAPQRLPARGRGRRELSSCGASATLFGGLAVVPPAPRILSPEARPAAAGRRRALVWNATNLSRECRGQVT